MLNREMVTNVDIQKEVWMYLSEIGDVLHSFGINSSYDLGFDCVYILLKSFEESRNGRNYKELLGHAFYIDNMITNIEKANVTDEVWKKLVDVAKKYSEDVKTSALIYPFSYDGRMEENATPDSLIKLAKRILDVKKTDNVADICSGVGNFITSTALDCPEAKYTGIDINVRVGDIAKAKADYLDSDIDYVSKDAFYLIDGVKYNKIFSNYPFGLRLRNLTGSAQIIEELLGNVPGASKATSSDWIFNTLIMNLLSEDGKAVALMTNGGTWNDLDSAIRRYFVENGYIESIIQLPSRMFQSTSIPTTMIVMSYGNEGVRIVDATKLCVEGRRYNEFSEENIETILGLLSNDDEISRVITVEELEKNNYSLSLGRYLFREVEVEHPALFSDVIKKITRGAQLSARQLDELVSDKPTDYQYMMLANVKDGMIDKELPYLKELDKKLEKYCVNTDEIILSKNGYPYKIAIASVKDGQKIVANGNMYVIELDKEKANPFYIKAYLESEQGIAALKSITVGATIPSIGVENLKGLTIPLPSIEEQNRIANEYQATLDEIAVLQLRLEKAKDKLKNVFQKGGK